MPRQKAAATVAVDLQALRKQVLKHNIETAMAATNRACDFRIREVDTLVENYITLIPPDLRSKKISDIF
jgi:hypothetical protein